MSDIDNKIEELKVKTQENLEAKELLCRNLGEFLLRESDDSRDTAVMEEYRNAALEIDSRISLMDQQFSEIEELETALLTIKDEEAGLQERKSLCQDNLNALQESLGEELYHLAKTQEPELPWVKAFDPLKQNLSKIRDHESELYKAENQVHEKNLFKGIVRKSKLTLMKSRKKSMENSQSKLYQKCFQGALLMGAGQGEDAGKDAELLAPWFRADKEWQAILEKEQKAEDQKLVSKDRLKELCGARGAKKRKDFLSKEKDLEKARLDEALVKWGESLAGDMPDSLKESKTVQDALVSIDKLTEEAIAINLEMEKWDARKDVERISTDQEYRRDKIAKLEEEILARKEEIKVLKKEITQADKEIAKKKSFAGDA